MNTRYNLRSGRIVYAPIQTLQRGDIVKFVRPGDRYKGRRGIIFRVTLSRVHIHIEFDPDERCIRSPTTVRKVGRGTVLSALSSPNSSQSRGRVLTAKSVSKRLAII